MGDLGSIVQHPWDERYIYLEPKLPLFWLEKTFFWRQNKGPHLGSRYLHFTIKIVGKLYRSSHGSVVQDDNGFGRGSQGVKLGDPHGWRITKNPEEWVRLCILKHRKKLYAEKWYLREINMSQFFRGQQNIRSSRNVFLCSNFVFLSWNDAKQQFGYRTSIETR